MLLENIMGRSSFVKLDSQLDEECLLFALNKENIKKWAGDIICQPIRILIIEKAPKSRGVTYLISH